MTDAAHTPPAAADEPAAKRPRPSPAAARIRITIKAPEWSYAHLQLYVRPFHPIPPSSTPSILFPSARYPACITRTSIYDPSYDAMSPAFPPDILTWRTTLSHALAQFLGVVGTAIHLDLLHAEHDRLWLRLPRSDAARFAAAVSGYVGQSETGRTVGFKVLGSANFLMGLVSKEAEHGVWEE